MSNQIYGPPPGGACPHGQIYSPCPKCLKPDSKLYVPCDDCKYEEDSPDCQRCEFEQTLIDNLFKDAEIVRLKKLARGNDTCLLELGEMCGNIDAKDVEIQRLKEDRALAIEAIKKDFDQLKSKAIGLEEDRTKAWDEITQIRAANESLSKSLDLANKDAIDLMIDKDRLIANLRTELAEERRLKDEARQEVVKIMMAVWGGRRKRSDIANDYGWGYLYEKEQ